VNVFANYETDIKAEWQHRGNNGLILLKRFTGKTHVFTQQKGGDLPIVLKISGLIFQVKRVEHG
jgi:hypothetical protein